MRAALACLVLLCLALAGCTTEAPELQRGLGDLLEPPGPPGADDNGTAGFDAPPAWERGQWWRFRVSGGRDDTRVVTADAGSAYLVGTDSETTALFEAQTDISNIGRIRKSDLAGEQGGAPVEYFRWPLVANSTWTTTWDGAPRTVRVVGPQVASMAGRAYPAMQLEAREGERVAVRYDFVPAVGWMSRADFINADGTSFVLSLSGFGRGFNGTVVEARLREVYRDEASGPLQPAGQFEVAAGASFLDVVLTLQGDAAYYQLGFRDPAGTMTNHQVPPCTANCSIRSNLTLPAVPGTWGLGAVGAVQGGQRPAQASLVISAVEFARRPV